MRERLVQDPPNPSEAFLNFIKNRLPEDHRRELRGYLENNKIGTTEMNQIMAHISEHGINPAETYDFLNAYAQSLKNPDSAALQKYLSERLRRQESPPQLEDQERPTPTTPANV